MSDKADDPASGSWHLDRRIPIALIITLGIAFIGQTFVFGWWGADMTARLTNVERVQTAVAPHSDRLTRVEVRIENIAENIVEIRNLLRQRGER